MTTATSKISRKQLARERFKEETRTHLDDLLEGPLTDAMDAALAICPTAGEIEANIGSILNLPQVAYLRNEINEYREAGRTLAEHMAARLRSGIQGKGILRTQPKSVAIISHLGLEAVCYQHSSRVTVAKISIQDTRTEGQTIEDMIGKKGGLRHSDLVYSHHDEEIQDGKLLCSDGHPAELEHIAQIYRLVPHVTVAQRKKAEDAIVAAVRNRFFQQASPQQVKRELEAAIGVGTTFDDIYHAMEQTRFYAVNASDLLRGMGQLDKKQARKFKLLTPKRFTSIRQELIELLEETIGKRPENGQDKQAYIMPPHLVVAYRIKGQSFADKYILNRHAEKIREWAKDGTYDEYMKSRGLPAWPGKPDRKKEPYSTPDLSDIIGVEAILHGDALRYDPSTNTHALPEGEDEGQRRVYETFRFITMVTGDKPERDYIIIGDKPGRDHTTRRRPKFKRTLIKFTPGAFDSKGIAIDFKKVDDYVHGPKPSGYQAFHVPIASLYVPHRGRPIKMELKIKSNFMDTKAEMYERQSHDAKKMQQAAQVGMLVDKGVLTREEVMLYRIMLSPENGYRLPNAALRN